MEKSKKAFKIEFNPNCDRDNALLEKLLGMVSESAGTNKKKLKPSDIFKKGLEVLTEKNIQELKEKLLTDQERLELWTKKYNDTYQKSYSPIEFAVQILPKLKANEMKSLETKGVR